MKKVIYLDDLDGESEGSVVRFGLDGTNYEIDLSAKNAAKLNAVLGPFVAVARVAGKPTSMRGQNQPAPSGYNKEQLKAIRVWASRHGYTVSDRGRIPVNVVEAFQASGGVGDISAVVSPEFSAV